MAHAKRKDDLYDSTALTPLETTEAMKANFKDRAETAFLRNMPLLNADDQNPSRKSVALEEKRFHEARKRELEPNDEDGHEAADKAIAAARAKMEAIDKEAELNTHIGACFRDYGKRFDAFKHENPKAVYVLNPISPASEPSMARVKELRLEDAKLEKAYERLENEPVPLADALAASDARVDLDHNAFNPSVYGFLSRHREDRFEWPHANHHNRALETIAEPNGGQALCWLFAEKVQERLRAKIKAAYTARGTEGMSRAQLKEARRKINEQRLAIQREEHSHVLGLEATGIMVDWRPDLSIFTVFQFSVPGITTLRGKGHQFSEPW